jgi:hypothetical protein
VAEACLAVVGDGVACAQSSARGNRWNFGCLRTSIDLVGR